MPGNPISTYGARIASPESDLFVYTQPVSTAAAKYLSIANETLSGLTVAGVAGVTTAAAGDVVLCTRQTNAANNGLWVVASGAWSRASAGDTAAKYVRMVVEIAGVAQTTHGYTGSRWRTTGWQSTSTLGATAMAWVRATNPPLTLHHGANGTTQAMLNDPDVRAMIYALADDYTVCVGDFGMPASGGGDVWGNSVGRARIASAYAYMQANLGCFNQRLGLLGVSMGGGTALNVVRNASDASIYGFNGLVTPLVSMADLVAYNSGQFAAAINAAYGGTYSDANHGSLNSPAIYGSAYRDDVVPTAIFSSPGDTVTREIFTTAFVQANPLIEHTNVSANLDHGPAAIAAFPLLVDWARKRRGTTTWERA